MTIYQATILNNLHWVFIAMLSQVRDILATIQIENLNLNLSQCVQDIKIQAYKITIIFELPSNDLSQFETKRQQAQQLLQKSFPDYQVLCITTTERSAPTNTSKKTIQHMVAVASGKGGVGKSTVAVNLAISFAQHGLKVGLLDADIYGPSLPKMMGISGKPNVNDQKKLIPLEKYGIKSMSIGLLIDEATPMIWRGPMVQGALMQLLKEVAWGELDILLIDMPPGTGDAQLSLAQQAQLSGAVIVSTPQDIAFIDALKSINMFRRVAIPIIGLVENMSQFSCPNCGHVSHIFAHGGVKAHAEQLKLPFLGSLPLDLSTRIGADEGTPITVSHPNTDISQTFSKIAQSIWQSLAYHVRQALKITIE
jgi:ATP-binding protein involved in chromosome partitioning